VRKKVWRYIAVADDLAGKLVSGLFWALVKTVKYVAVLVLVAGIVTIAASVSALYDVYADLKWDHYRLALEVSDDPALLQRAGTYVSAYEADLETKRWLAMAREAEMQSWADYQQHLVECDLLHDTKARQACLERHAFSKYAPLPLTAKSPARTNLARPD